MKNNVKREKKNQTFILPFQSNVPLNHLVVDEGKYLIIEGLSKINEIKVRECKYHDFAMIIQPLIPSIKYQWQLTSQKDK